MINQILTAVIGAIVGFSSGLFGIGGSLIATPLLRTIVDLAPLLALASPLPAVIPSAISGSFVYARQGLIDTNVLRITLICGAPAVAVGSYVTRFVDGTVLMVLTGAFLLLVGGTFIIRGWLLRTDVVHIYQPTPLRVAGIGIVAGFFAGLLAVGGGIVFVPAFVRLLRMPLKQALATSLICVGCFAIPGTIIHAWLGHIDWMTTLILAIMVIPFSNIGARLAVKLRNQTLERTYGVFLMVFAVWFIFSQIT